MLYPKHFILFIAFFSAEALYSQKLPQPFWQRTLGGYGTEIPTAFIKTFDNGYVIVSSNYQTSGGDISSEVIEYDDYYGWVVKLDSTRNIVWQRKTASAKWLDVLQTHDSGIVVLGLTQVTKYNKNGAFLWTYKHPYSSDEASFEKAIENIDGSITICGYNNTPYEYKGINGWLLNLSPTGLLRWEKSYPGTNPNGNRSLKFETIINSIDGNYLIGGSYDSTFSNSFGLTRDYYVAQISLTGDIIWYNTFDGINAEDDLTSIIRLPDNTYAVCGYTTIVDDRHCFGDCNSDIWILKISPTGSKIAEKKYGDRDSDKAVDMLLYKSGIYVLGYSNSKWNDFSANRGEYDILGFKLDYDLNLISTYELYGGPKNDWGVKILIDSTKDQVYPVILSRTESESGGQVEGFHDISYASGEEDIWLFKLGEFNSIVGNAFYDYNKNSVKDDSEPYYKRGIIISAGENDSVFTYNSNGSYLHRVLSYNYNTELRTNDTAFIIVPKLKKSFFSNYFNIDTINFALQLKKGFFDISTSAYAETRSRPGFETTYEAMLVNKSGDTVIEKEIYLIKDNNLIYKNAIPQPIRVNGDSIIWKYTGLKPTDTLRFHVQLSVLPPPTSNIGDTIKSYFFAPLNNDIDTSDNFCEITQVLSGAFDPNEKEESHDGNIDISRAIKGEFLTYIIRFQNTGNDTAINVVVKDALDKNLDIGSFEMIKSSHPYSILIQGNTLQWSFRNIYLPDSIVNEKESHGYFVYRVRVKKSVQPDSYIYNSASIYFDYNPPIITNTSITHLTRNKINGNPDEVSRVTLATVFPNPTQNVIWLKYAGLSSINVSIAFYDMQGRKVGKTVHRELLPANSYRIEIPGLPGGVYLMKLLGSQIDESHKIIILQ